LSPPKHSPQIFPPQSLSYLNLIATIGLCLFLFVIGVETDFSLFKRNARATISISAGGILLPFALGAGMAKGLYDTYIDKEPVTFGHFMLFVSCVSSRPGRRCSSQDLSYSVAFSITAFPVLARILAELQLLNNDVGVTVASLGFLSSRYRLIPLSSFLQASETTS
jgi:Kef-type K+ transport system membrane component KefB